MAPRTAAPTLAPWYVCITKPRQEAQAAAKLLEQGYEVWLPMLQHWVRHAGAWHRKQAVMFPRYAFVRPTREQQSLSPVRSTPGVTGLVTFGPVLACLAADRLKALRAVVAERAAAQPDKPLQPGRHVTFASGPLKGRSGIVSAVAAERVLVLMSLLGREQTVAVQPDALALA
jgi:transcriptional antiterminator RfaH